MEEPKSVVIVGESAPKLSEELRKVFSPDEYDFKVGAEIDPAPTKVMIFLTTGRRFRHMVKKSKELVAMGCKVLVICTDNQSLEMVVDKAGGFLRGILLPGIL